MTQKEILINAIDRITTLQRLITMFDEIVSFLVNTRRINKLDSGNIRYHLIDAELEEWRGAAMWGLTVKGELQDRIKATIYQRFLSEGYDIAKWLNPDGVTPSSWLAEDEKTFREMARKAFAPEESVSTT